MHTKWQNSCYVAVGGYHPAGCSCSDLDLAICSLLGASGSSLRTLPLRCAEELFSDTMVCHLMSTRLVLLEYQLDLIYWLYGIWHLSDCTCLFRIYEMVSTNANTASAGIRVVLRTVGRFCLNNFKNSSYIFSKSVTIARHYSASFRIAYRFI